MLMLTENNEIYALSKSAYNAVKKNMDLLPTDGCIIHPKEGTMEYLDFESDEDVSWAKKKIPQFEF